jgi:hypothetical protein
MYGAANAANAGKLNGEPKWIDAHIESEDIELDTLAPPGEHAKYAA